MTETAIVGAKGQIVIPARIRRELGIEPGQKVTIRVEGRKLTLRPVPRDLIASLTGRFADGSSLTQALIREHAEELERDERRACPKVAVT